MNSRQRHRLIRSVLMRLRERGAFPDFAVFVNADHPDEYAQITVTDGGSLVAEVGSREWVDPVRPLGESARAALAALGFAGGGAERNYARSDLPDETNEVALLLSHAFDAAYGRRGADLMVKTNVHDIEPWLRDRGLLVEASTSQAVLQTVTFDMIRGALATNGWRAFHDEMGDCLMTFWEWDPDLGQIVHVYYDIEGEPPYSILSIHAVGGTPVARADRGDTLALINTWNQTKRWPAASLCTGSDGYSWVHGSWSLPAKAFVSQAMVQDVVDAVTLGALEFFRWLRGERFSGAAHASEPSSAS